MATTGAKTTIFENLILDHLFRAEAAPNTGLYIGLVTGNPTFDDDNAATLVDHEVVKDSGYNRQAIHRPIMGAASAGVITTTDEINFGTSSNSAGWGTVTGFFINTETSAGVTYYYGVFDTEKSVATGDSVRITAGNLTIEEQ